MAAAPTTTKIMIIRHAEKPPSIGEPFGVTAEGEQDVESLMIQGWQRAGALACFFAPARGPLQSAELATPQFLFASESKSGGGSARPVETITPLASKLGLTPKTHKKSSLRQGCGRRHGLRGHRAHLLAARGHSWHCQHHPGKQTTVPQQWPGARFDVVWVFDLDPSSSTYSFKQVPQSLLPGDSAEPIGAPS